MRLIAQDLENCGHVVDNWGLQEPLPVSHDVISLIDDTRPFFEKDGQSAV